MIFSDGQACWVEGNTFLNSTLFDIEGEIKNMAGKDRKTEKKYLNLTDLQRQTQKQSISHLNVLFILTPASTEGLFAYSTKMLLN